MWERRCLQGTIQGSQTFFWSLFRVSELRTAAGWIIQDLGEGAVLRDYLNKTLQSCHLRTLHVRIFSQIPVDSEVLIPDVFNRGLVLEWSFHPLEGGPRLPCAGEAWRGPHEVQCQADLRPGVSA